MIADTIIFYDRSGAAIAYTLEDGETLYTYGGRPAGYLFEDGVFSFAGKFLGWHLDGWVVDSDGARVFFTKGSKGGPVTPIKGIQPIRGIRQYCPGRMRRFGKGLKPAFSLVWSPRSGEIFFGEVTFTGVKSTAPRPGSPAPAEPETEAVPADPPAQTEPPAPSEEPGRGDAGAEG